MKQDRVDERVVMQININKVRNGQKIEQINRQLRRTLILVITVALVTSSLTYANVSAYNTVGALGRSLDVSANFTINRTLLAPLAPAGVEGCREGQLLHNFAGITIHETSNWSSNANALMHAQYLRGGGQTFDVSWHYAVDSTSAYQCIPENEKAWHAGDTANGKGNAQTIAIEICDNSAGSFDQAMANAEWLAADVLYRHGVYSVGGYLFQHHDFSAYGKNCPITIRDTGRWGEFCSKTQGFLNAMINQKGTYTPILMTPTATVDQAKNWAAAHGASAQFILLADLYWEIAPQSGVDPVVAYAQSAHETAFGRFGGVIDASYFNPSGLRTAAGGDNYDPAAHQHFSSWREGVQAHIDHLALYAGQLGYAKSTSPDPRQFSYLFGIAPGVEDLSGKWEPSSTYGGTVVAKMNQIQSADATPYFLGGEVANIDIISYQNGIITANVTTVNTGKSTWTEDVHIRLGFGLDTADQRVILPAGGEVNAGEVYTFTFALRVPDDGTTHTLVAGMVHDGVEWFGNTYKQEIGPKSAKILAINGPASLLIGQTQDVLVTVENTGVKDWVSDAYYRLATDSSNTVSNRTFMTPGTRVAPGDTYTFAIAAQAQDTAGTAVINMQMVQDGVTFFGQKSTLKIPVTKPATAEISSVTMQDTITAGGEFKAHVTVKNTGSATWTEKDLIRLGVEGTATGNNRAHLPAGVSVRSGESYTFTYTAAAPSSGDLILNFQMVKDGVCWFGDVKTITIKTREAQIISSTVPAKVLAGQSQDFTVTVKNTGLTAWNADAGYRLATDASSTLSNRSYITAGTIVAPGETYMFTVTVQPPETQGTAVVNLQMVQDGITFFGQQSSLQIPVKNPLEAEIVAVSMPDAITAGGVFTTQITVKNTDAVSWTEKNMIRLGIEGTAIGNNRVHLPDGVTVHSGESYTFIYTASAPSSGDLIMNIQMVKDGVCWFGSAKSITVKTRDAQVVSVTAPAEMLAGQPQDISITVKNTGLTNWEADTNYRLSTDASNTSNTRYLMPGGTKVAPGETYTFIATVQPQNTPGTAVINMQMVQDGVTFFGQLSKLEIPVKYPAAAEITSAVLPDVIGAGSVFTAQITVKNTDTLIWTEKDLIRLGIEGTAIGNNRIQLPEGVSVKPGESYTFTYTATAPVSGNLTLHIQMVKDGICWFGNVKDIETALVS